MAADFLLFILCCPSPLQLSKWEHTALLLEVYLETHTQMHMYTRTCNLRVFGADKGTGLINWAKWTLPSDWQKRMRILIRISKNRAGQGDSKAGNIQFLRRLFKLLQSYVCLILPPLAQLYLLVSWLSWLCLQVDVLLGYTRHIL